jgi:hypothetical protein
VVKRKDGSWSPLEVTSKTASKVEQLAKESEIRQSGGVFVRNPQTRQLVELADISRVIRVE